MMSPGLMTLGGPPLVGRQDVFDARDLSYRRLEFLPRTAAGVTLVAEHHGGPLLGGHGAGARIGEEIDTAILCVDQEDVVVGRGECLLALGEGRDLEGFRHLDAEGFDDRAHIHPPGVVRPRLRPGLSARGGQSVAKLRLP